MKKLLFRNLILAALLILALVEHALAADSFSIPVSCNIPALPGINAPLITQEQTKEIVKPVQEISLEKEIASPQLIQEEENKEMKLAQGNKITVTVMTSYSK